MKKLWNHYDPLDFEDMGQEGEAPPAVPAPVRHKKRGAIDRLYAWLFKAEAEEEISALRPASGASPASAPVAPMQDELKRQRQEIAKALNEWKAASAYFENVADPALVDYAVYGMEAAQKRYIYLLRGAAMQDADRQLPLP